MSNSEQTSLLSTSLKHTIGLDAGWEDYRALGCAVQHPVKKVSYAIPTWHYPGSPAN